MPERAQKRAIESRSRQRPTLVQLYGLQREPQVRRDAWIVVLVCLLSLLAFVDKAFHIDDTLFVWAAQHIQKAPFDPYGFRVGWDFVPKPMWEETKNPPLTCYYLALAGWLTGGWREVPLHVAFLIWPIGAAWGTYRLAQRFCSRPLLAALAAFLTPVMLVSATSVMCDVMMLCIWVWALVWWDRGLRSGSMKALTLAAFLAGVCPLTKYFGITLLPLLIVYTLFFRAEARGWRAIPAVLREADKFWKRLVPLVIPAILLAGYQYVTWRLYGRGLLSDAASYATDLRGRFVDRFPLPNKFLMGLVFTGGCVAVPFFYVPLLWKARQIARAALVLVAVGLLCVLAVLATGSARLFLWTVSWQAPLFLAAGVTVLVLVMDDLRSTRDAAAWLLFFWVVGTMVFAAFINWAVNGRSVLPLVPAVGILIMRRLDRARGPATRSSERWFALPLLPSVALALAVAYADVSQADTARTAARVIADEYAHPPGKLLFEGRWGFQYYLEQRGGQPVTFALDPGTSVLGWIRPTPAPGDRLVEPSNNSHVFTRAYRNTPFRMPRERVELARTYTFFPCGWLSTTQPALRAGFYSHTFGGELPYAFGRVPPEVYWVYTIR